MEFPKLGKYCSKLTCNKFDFLPIKCDACRLDFCIVHFRYEAHNCQYVRKKMIPNIQPKANKFSKLFKEKADILNIKLNSIRGKDPVQHIFKKQTCRVCNRSQQNCLLREHKPDLSVGYIYKNEAYRNDSPTVIHPYVNILNNICTFQACKQKELLKITCPHCSRNYCTKHKHPIDHLCNGLKFKRGSPVFKENLAHF